MEKEECIRENVEISLLMHKEIAEAERLLKKKKQEKINKIKNDPDAGIIFFTQLFLPINYFYPKLFLLVILLLLFFFYSLIILLLLL